MADPTQMTDAMRKIMAHGKKKLEYNEGSLDSIGSGFSNTNLREMVPNYAAASSEKEIRSPSHNNARIILGRDRNGSIASGYGSKGHTRSGAIKTEI